MGRFLCTCWLLCWATAAMADLPLPVSRWLYGAPIAGLVEGQVYLIEFTHTQCAPCRKSLPLLTALAKRYAGRVSVIGIFSYFPSDRLSEGDYIHQIQALKRAMGDQLDFPIALDHRDQRTYRAFAPERAGGFPTLVIVDGTGTVRWQGTSLPMAETLLAALLSDPVGWDADREARLELGRKRSQRLYASGQRTLALDVLDSLKTMHPESVQALDLVRFRLLIPDDASGATAALCTLLDRDPSFHTDLKPLGRQRNTQTLGLPMGYALAERVFRHSRDPILRAYTCVDLAFLHFRHGQHHLASQWIEQATHRYGLIDPALQSEHSAQELAGYRYLIDWRLAHTHHPENAVKALRQTLAEGGIKPGDAKLLKDWLYGVLDDETLEILDGYLSVSRGENR